MNFLVSDKVPPSSRSTPIFYLFGFPCISKERRGYKEVNLIIQKLDNSLFSICGNYLQGTFNNTSWLEAGEKNGGGQIAQK